MRYPNQLTLINDDLSIYIPDYEQVRIIYEALLKSDQKVLFPFWAKLWPSSLAIVQFLKDHPNWVKDKNVLEIGAGLGLPSFIIAGMAKSIQVTDYDPEAVELMKKNIQHLKLHNVQALTLDWNHVPETMEPELMLLSDVNYNPNQFENLTTLIKRFIAQDAVVVMSTPQRIIASPFVIALQEFVRYTQTVVVKENEKSTEISILVLTK